MANGMGSLYIGASGLRNSQNALNTTANNLANVDTKGYVRQQVLFADMQYVTFDNKTNSISKQQAGLGVSIGEVVHTRDIFLDKYYRNEAGRQAFYDTTYTAINQIEDVFQEMEGEAMQNTFKDFYVAFQELAKTPDDTVQQGLVIQKATLLIERAQAVNSNLRDYQKNMNIQIEDSVKRINELGKEIKKLNLQIQKIEAGHQEKAMTFRDARDLCLDELSTLARIDFKEMPDGVVKVSIEGEEFVDEVILHPIDLREDRMTGFLTPYWTHLSNIPNGKYTDVFDLSAKLSTANNSDIGKLKALILARGDRFANYMDLFTKVKETDAAGNYITDADGNYKYNYPKDADGNYIDLTQYDYNNGIGQSVVMNGEAELDRWIHEMITSINDLLCPNKTVMIGGEPVLVWDEEHAAYGNDGKKPGNELFTRTGTDRYDSTPVTGDDGELYYVFNEESSTDTSKQYTINSLNINQALLDESSNLPYKKAGGTNINETDVALAEALRDLFEKDLLILNPNDTDKCNFSSYYQRMLGDVANRGSICMTLKDSITGSVAAIDNQRQQVIGVSSDEELTNMIKYQNAYNASSRFINVISEMIEHLLTKLG
ncbi:hypothetical protein FACS1894111_05060 [Clostridia bacterium]|nr:hypothetical protein FACS1894111_05060 [Clostridia bacterium]